MRPRSLRPLAFVAAAALTALLAPAPAAGQAPSIANVSATDFAFTTDGGGPANVTIAAGGHVNFAYFTGNSLHNVVFPGARPTVCGTSEGPAGTTAALPAVPSPPLWEGGCDFDVAGTYAFVCGVHPQMSGSVTAVQTAASPPPPPLAVELSIGPDGHAVAGDLKVALSQRGNGIRGSVLVARGGARLSARVFARRKALSARSRSTREVQVGRHVRSTGGGRADRVHRPAQPRGPRRAATQRAPADHAAPDHHTGGRGAIHGKARCHPAEAPQSQARHELPQSQR